MPGGGEPAGWDYLSVATAWSLYGLPAVLIAAIAFILLKQRGIVGLNAYAADLDGRRIVGVVALIHLALGLHGAMRFAQELLTMRAMGVTESFVNFVVQASAAVVNPLLAVGFWYRRGMARRLAILWYLVLSAYGLYSAYWLWHYQVPFVPRKWPEHLAGKAMPLFLLGVMFLARVKRAFARRAALGGQGAEAPAGESSGDGPRRWSVVSIVAVLFLIVVTSNFADDSAEWIDRVIASWGHDEPS